MPHYNIGKKLTKYGKGSSGGPSFHGATDYGKGSKKSRSHKSGMMKNKSRGHNSSY